MQYDVALICGNGHLITANLCMNPEDHEAFCSQCGAPTISECPHCHKKIKGRLADEFFITEYDVPAYCIYCGEPFPWTTNAIESTALIIREESSFNEQEQNALIEVLPDIIVETPKTNLAAVRLKKCLASAGKFTAEAVRQFALDFGCELAKKSLGL